MIPSVRRDLSTKTVLTTDLLDGVSLDSWMATEPDQEARDRIAALLYDQFLYSLYELKCVHADPNPGNFMVLADGSVGVVDFGCVKRFSQEFIDQHRQISRTLVEGDKADYFRQMEELNMLRSDLDTETEEQVYQTVRKIQGWYSRLYQSDIFDFGLTAISSQTARSSCRRPISIANTSSPTPNSCS